ncbi:MAG: hypothetical protein ACR2LM_13045 [Pyrinomonadaceae bacterium]
MTRFSKTPMLLQAGEVCVGICDAVTARKVVKRLLSKLYKPQLPAAWAFRFGVRQLVAAFSQFVILRVNSWFVNHGFSNTIHELTRNGTN